MRSITLLFLVWVAFTAVTTRADTVESPTRWTSDQISQFNNEVSQAVKRGEEWPCSPFILTYKIFRELPSEEPEGAEVFCRKSVEDIIAIVLVRNTQLQIGKGSEWFELQFQKLIDSTWRLVCVDSTTAQFGSTHLTKSIYSELVMKKVGQVFPAFGGEYDSKAHGQIRYSVEENGVSVDLLGQPSPAFLYVQPDSTILIGTFPTGRPTPYSIQRFIFSILAQSEITITVQKGEGGEIRAFNFGEVVPGPYLVELGGQKLETGKYFLQIWYNGEPSSISIKWRTYSDTELEC